MSVVRIQNEEYIVSLPDKYANVELILSPETVSLSSVEADITQASSPTPLIFLPKKSKKQLESWYFQDDGLRLSDTTPLIRLLPLFTTKIIPKDEKTVNIYPIPVSMPGSDSTAGYLCVICTFEKISYQFVLAYTQEDIDTVAQQLRAAHAPSATKVIFIRDTRNTSVVPFDRENTDIFENDILLSALSDAKALKSFIKTKETVYLEAKTIKKLAAVFVVVLISILPIYTYISKQEAKIQQQKMKALQTMSALNSQIVSTKTEDAEIHALEAGIKRQPDMQQALKLIYAATQLLNDRVIVAYETKKGISFVLSGKAVYRGSDARIYITKEVQDAGLPLNSAPIVLPLPSLVPHIVLSGSIPISN